MKIKGRSVGEHSLSLSLSLSPPPPPLSLSFSLSHSPSLYKQASSISMPGYQLLALEACSSERSVPSYMSKVVTPLKLQAWHDALSDYPDKTFAAYILRGIEMGFKIGFHTELVNLKSQKGNLSTALEQPEVVEKYLHEELQANRVIKIHPSDDVKGLGIQCSPFGVIPKKNRRNKWRLIVDLSAPQGHSVNDGISKELAILSYVSVDEVVSGVLQRGKGAMIAKMDIHHAYRNIPIHPSDRVLLGMQWKGETYVDVTLPFGLRSAPLIFSALADALQWIMERMGAQ